MGSDRCFVDINQLKLKIPYHKNYWIKYAAFGVLVCFHKTNCLARVLFSFIRSIKECSCDKYIQFQKRILTHYAWSAHVLLESECSGVTQCEILQNPSVHAKDLLLCWSMRMWHWDNACVSTAYKVNQIFMIKNVCHANVNFWMLYLNNNQIF